MADPSFQDVVGVIASGSSLAMSVQALQIGSDAGAKSIVLSNDVAGLFIAANPTANRTIVFPDASGSLGLMTALIAGAGTFTNGGLSFSNLNGVSFGINGSTITASVSPGAAGGIAISAGAASATSGTVIFSNSNGVSFGLNGQTMTANIDAIFGISGGTTSTSDVVAVFSNSNNVSFGLQGATMTATASVALSIAAISGGTTSFTNGAAVLSNANGVSFGVAGNTITASVVGAVPGFSMVDWQNLTYSLSLTNIVNINLFTARPIYIPFYLPGSITAQQIIWEGSRSTTGSNNFAMSLGIYSLVNSTQITLISSTGVVYSNSATASQSNAVGFMLPSPITSFAPGSYVLGVMWSAAATASLNYFLRGGGTNPGPAAFMNTGTDNISTATTQISSIGYQFFGMLSTTTNAMPGSQGTGLMLNATVLGGASVRGAIPMWFLLRHT